MLQRAPVHSEQYFCQRLLLFSLTVVVCLQLQDPVSYSDSYEIYKGYAGTDLDGDSYNDSDAK